MDSIIAEATLVDGSVLSFTAVGDSLDSIFNNEQLTFAQSSDYASFYSDIDMLGFDSAADSTINPLTGWMSDDSLLTGPFNGDSLVDPSPVEVDYADMDWQSFEDEPLDEYSSSLSATDFAAMQTPESYLDYSNDIDSLDFI